MWQVCGVKMSACVRACVCACVHACVRVCMCECVRACACVCMCACMCMCVCVCFRTVAVNSVSEFFGIPSASKRDIKVPWDEALRKLVS